jgi:alkylation response protein AidB-like acyl-CoA dehydrogenase
VDFELSEQQASFQRVLRNFAAREDQPSARQAERAGDYPPHLVEQMRDLGLFGITVPADYGGLSLDSVSIAIVFRSCPERGWE